MMKQPDSEISSSDPTGSPEKGGFYLRSRTKIWVLATCLALMIGVSVYAVLQPLNPNPSDTTLAARLRYPHETNPYARLQAVNCAQDKSNDYACRLNSVAVNGAGNLPEVWAVGNVGLVLHRKAGESKWEQLTIFAREENAASPQPTPTPIPGPRPSPAATPRPSPVATPTPGVTVPDLRGLNREIAEKTAAASGFQLHVGYENTNALNQQGPPPDLRVLKQDPEAGTRAAPKSTINVVMGRARSGAQLFMDKLVPTVYAAEPEKQPRQQQQQQQTPPQSHVQRNPPQRTTPSNGTSAASAPRANLGSRLDDDLIHVSCNEDSRGCMALGRSGRYYDMRGGNEWSFNQYSFAGLGDDASHAFTLLAAASANWLLGKSGETIYRCSASTIRRNSYNCYSVSADVKANGQTELKASSDNLLYQTLANGQTQEFFFFNSNQGIHLRPGAGGRIEKPDANGTASSARLIPSGTTANLRPDALVYERSGFIVGDHGIILSTTDGGNTWHHETQGPEGRVPNHRLPAVWYWVVAFLLILTCSVVVAIPPPPPVTEFSVADWSVTDAPLKPGDLDSLDFTPMALGLSRFIRNPKTQPPVTIAIEGEWGEGKSSVMGLLRGDLEKSRFRPVWFNAWHHQSEDQLLAALLEHIKSQAVPPWWHIDNWIFRARLLHIRFREKWPQMIALVLALCAGIAFELSRHGLKWEDLSAFGRDLVQLAKYLLPWSNEKNPPQDLGHFGLVVTMLAVFAAIFKKVQAFGINPAKLTDNLRDAATIKDVKPDPGIRRQFAREFGDLCSAWCWGGRRVIIFIDDLDRCRPESVVTVLESINFLTTAGDCMIVLGMAQKQVTHCVGLSFKEIAQSENAYKGGGDSEQAKAVARFNYGSLYIKKLVNIVAPLPKTTQEQRRRVLEVRAAAALQEEREKASKAAEWRMSAWESLSEAGRLSFKIAPVFGLVLAVILSVVIGYKQGIQQTPDEPARPQITAQGDKTVKPPDVSNLESGGTAQPLIYTRPTTQPATLAEADNVAAGVWWSYGVDGLFLVILFGTLAYQLSARSNQDAQNSPDFEQSLQLWGRYIVGVCDTPREIKRALNDLRYQAMTRRNNGPSNTRGERLLRTLRQFVTGRSEKAPIETHVDEAALPPRKAAELANLTDDEWKYFLDPAELRTQGSENFKLLIELKAQHLKQFKGRWIGEAKPGDVSPASGPVPNIGAENVAARAAQQA